MQSNTLTIVKERRGRAGRAKLLKAALGVFSRKGFADTTVDEICLAAGYSKGGFYFHFRSKDDVLAQLISEETRAVADAAFVSPQWSQSLLSEIWALASRQRDVQRLLAAHLAKRRQAFQQRLRERKGGKRINLAGTLLAIETGLQVQSRLTSSHHQSCARGRLQELLSVPPLPAEVTHRELSRQARG
jgi:AcrR family transcriptional regulator